MIFKNILDDKYWKLFPLFDELFDLATKNQTHSGDLLLVMEHALLTCEEDATNPTKPKLGYQIGTELDYHCETTNYEFIREYVHPLAELQLVEYLKLHEYSQERADEVRQLSYEEGITIQVEMLIYLKIWEGETFLKKWYQLTRLINGKDYDWHCTIKIDKNNKPGSLKRYEFLKQIKDQLENKGENYYG